jgi:malate dehydrogenase (oxaloacetate-decarboxylating)(NADP+)
LAPRLGGGSTIGPLLIGLTHAAQLVAMDSSVSQIVDVAALAAHQTITGR